MKDQGFTLPEVLVALAVFSLIVAAAVNLLLSSLSSQQISFAQDQALFQTSSLGEYMGRALRQAQKDISGSCVGAGGINFGLQGSAEIRFLNSKGFCQQFSLSGTQIVERMSSDSSAANFGAPVALTSNNVPVQSLQFALMGENENDALQPRVTFEITIHNNEVQTTISQRNFDVRQ